MVSLFRRIWPGTFLGAAGGYFAYVISQGADLASLFGVDPSVFARFTFLVVAMVYVFEPEIKKMVEKKASE